MKTVFIRAMSSQRAALIFRSDNEIKSHSRKLSVPEQLLLGYHLTQLGRHEEAAKLFQSAQEKAEKERSPLGLRADVFRLIAQLHAAAPDGPNISGLRLAYVRNLKILFSAHSAALTFQAVNSVFEWSVFEHTGGDWRCGEQLSGWAFEVLGQLPAGDPTVAAFTAAFRATNASLQPQPTQTRAGCDDEMRYLQAARGTQS